MVKEPRAGRVKTRLGRDIGMTGAAWWFRHQVSRLLREVQDPRWELILSVAPDTARSAAHAAFGLINSTPHSNRLTRPEMAALLQAMALGALRELS